MAAARRLGEQETPAAAEYSVVVMTIGGSLMAAAIDVLGYPYSFYWKGNPVLNEYVMV